MPRKSLKVGAKAEQSRQYQRKYYQLHKKKAKEYQHEYYLEHRRARIRTARRHGRSDFVAPRLAVKDYLNKSDIIHTPVEKLPAILHSIISGKITLV